MKLSILAIGCFICVATLADEPGSASGLNLHDCRISAGPGYPSIRARCGVLLRPEDPAHPETTQLSLKVALVPALNLEPQPDPFVPIAGGPGQSTIRFYAAYRGAFERIRRERDILLLDQRGTGESAPLNCDVDEEVLKGRFSAAETIASTKACIDALPHDPRFFTTSVAVTDLEALRQAIDAPALNLYGVSYGSRVAQHYLRRFPEKTRSVILDGVAPPQLALGPGIAIEAQKALDAIFSRCSESERCQARFPDLQREFAELDATLRAAPLTLDVADPLTGVLESVTFGELELAGAIRLLSYDPNTVALLPLLVHEAAQGNLHPLVAQFQMISASMEDALSLGMHNAIVCSEDYPHFATSEYSREDAEVSYIGPLMLDALEAMCSVWPIGPVDIGFHAPVRSATPVLLLSGEADPVTPPRFAEMAAVDLSNARHITGRRQGHGQAIRGCMPEVIGRFVQSASVDDLQEDCFERVFAMPFFLDFTGPAP